MTNIEEFMKLVRENPDLPIVPMVNEEIVADTGYSWWMGRWGCSKVTEYYLGEECVHFKDADEEEVLADMRGCRHYCTADGTDITELPDDEWNRLYQSIPWIKAIVVYITI